MSPGPKTPLIIRTEHRDLGALLGCMGALVKEIDAGKEPDFRVFHAILVYLDTFLERFHHPKEDAYLFPALVRRHPPAKALIAELQAQHVRGARLLEELRKALSAYEAFGDQGWPEFRRVALEYVDLERVHARKEENEILPLAQAHLTAADWESIDAVFAENRDPLFGRERRREFENLFSVIANLAPAPYGFGKSWEEAATEA